MGKRLIHFTRGTRTYRLSQRRVFRMLLSMRGSAETIALGFAIGMFVAFTPTVGVQMLIAVGLATLFRASRPASIVPVWITNPATLAPIYLFTYKIGKFFFSGPPVEEVARGLGDFVARISSLEFYAFLGAFKELASLGKDVMIPMTIGGIIVGGIGAAITYPLALWCFRTFHNFMEHRRAKRRLRWPSD